MLQRLVKRHSRDSAHVTLIQKTCPFKSEKSVIVLA